MTDAAENFDEFQATAIVADDEALLVQVDGFEGPLDLLLTLARNQKVDIAKISILKLAEQYLEFIESAKKFKKLGVDTVACVAVNDPFVLAAWEKKADAKGKVLFLSDGNAEFTKMIGMNFDGSGVGLGTRSKRYAALVEDGVVKALNVEDSPGVAVESTAAKLLERL